MDKENRLLQIVEKQQGYFTSRQAEECGFSRANFHHKLRAEKWCKEDLWGIYRIANYPSTIRSELALWTLWSADREGNPQGIWSHETALDIHELSDVASAKLHMSVPRSFRKSNKIPNKSMFTLRRRNSTVRHREQARISGYHTASHTGRYNSRRHNST